jgi:hypothetical protein
VIEHDFLSFKMLCESCQRLEAQSKMQQVTLMGLGFNGMGKDGKKLWNQWMATADLGVDDDSPADGDALAKAIGGGF